MKIYGIEVINNKPQVCSRVIAEQLDKEHKHVLGKIRDVLTQSEYWQREYSYGNNNKAKEYIVDKDAFILLVMNYEGYNDFKRAYIKQFNLMEEELKNNKPSYVIEDPIKRAEKWIEEQKQVKQLAIKAQVADELTSKEGLMLPSDAGRTITGHPNLFCKWLEDENIVFHRKGKMLPYARYEKYFEVKVSTSDTHSYSQTYFNNLGLAWIKAKYLKANGLLQLDYKEQKEVSNV